MPPREQPAEAPESPFVGRDAELAQLRAGLEDALAGRGRFFLVEGEAGIGKTRLVEEVAREAVHRGHRVLWGRCWEGEGAPHYWPWTQVLRAALADARPERGREAPVAAPPLAQILPEILPEIGRFADSHAAPTQPDSARFDLFDALSRFLGRASQQQPLVLVFDDLHWSDVPSALLLRFVVHELRTTPMVVVATYRETDARCDAQIAKAIGALAREGRHLSLRAFATDDVARLIESRTGRRAPAAVVQAIEQETDGNPFFVTEVVHLLAAGGAFASETVVVPPSFPVPQGVRQAIRLRVAALPGDCRTALAIAAVIGRQFAVGTLQRAARLEPEALLDALGPALQRAIVVPDPGSVGRYRFAHALIRETIYADLGPAQRARLHGRVGDAMLDLPSTNRSSDLAVLAHHFAEAVPAVGAGRAIRYCTEAARYAESALAYEDAAALFGRALELRGDATPADAAERCDLLLARGGAQWKSGDGEGARATFLRAADAARRIGDARGLARSALGFAGEGSRLLWVRSGIVDQPRIDLLEEALHRLGDADPGLRAQLLARLSINLYWGPESDRELATSEEALALARRQGDPSLLASALRARLVALWRPDASAERLAVADEIVGLGQRTGDRDVSLFGRRFRVVAFLESGDTAAADREIAAYAELTKEPQRPWYAADVAMWRATRAIMDGRFADGAEQATRAHELAEREGDAQPGMRHEIQTMVLGFHVGRLDRHAERPRSPGDVGSSTFLRCHRAFWASRMGRHGEAARELAALARDDHALPRDGGWLVSASLLSVVASDVSDRTSAEALYERLSPYADRVAVAAAGLACWGSVAHYLGLLAATLGRVDDAIAHYREAAAMHERMGARPFLAWTQLAHGRLLATRAAGLDEPTAASLLASAVAIADELGMSGLLAEARGVQGDAGTRAHGGIHVDAGRPPDRAAVFRNEGDFWTVVYAGKAVRLRHGKGLVDIATLLAHPGREVHVADLIAASAPAALERAGGEALANDLRVSGGPSGMPILDGRARTDYRRRLAELHREIEDAESCHDSGRAARARAELDFIAGELASAFGLGGRSRRAGSPVERARKAVASRIRFSLAHIAEVHPALARHLRRYLRTGTVCAYSVPDEPVDWSL
ncbi:MAG TPA: AAA family ATPase [Candidatus Binatia bacterium]|nr:AAA family ATPase [Candidatus Binatia bacterium]